MNAGGTFDLNGFNQVVGDLFGSGFDHARRRHATLPEPHELTIFSGAISGTGGFVKNGTGTLVLTGDQHLYRRDHINAGTLDVNGSIATSSLTSVNSGGTLAGTGTVGDDTDQFSGGTFAPGSGRRPAPR